jgi:hypothetical protein
MNKEIGEQWVKDLLSGEFAQTTGALRSEEGFCCYGVLAERAVEAGVLVRTERNAGNYLYCSATDISDQSYGVLPIAAWQWAGLNGQNPVMSDGAYLTELNDDRVSFEEIAARIKEDLLEDSE